MEKRENLLDVIETFFRWKRPIFMVCLIAAIGSVGISLLMPNYYKSSTVYYVASPDQAMPEPVGARLKVKSIYGKDGDIDRNLTIAQSGELVDYMVEKYDLYKHYDINPEANRAAFKVREKFLDLYTAKRTKFDAIELSVEDTNKELATQMVNDIREKIIDISRQLLKKSFHQQMRSYEQNLGQKELEIKIMGDSLQQLRARYGVYNSLSQSEFMSSLVATTEAQLSLSKAKLQAFKTTGGIPRDSINYMAALVSGYENELTTNQKNLNKLNEGMAIVDALYQSYRESTEQLSLDKERYKQIKAAHDAKPTILYLVEEGTIPVIKSRPKRSIICIAAVLIAFIMSFAGAILLDNYKDVDWTKIKNAK